MKPSATPAAASAAVSRSISRASGAASPSATGPVQRGRCSRRVPAASPMRRRQAGKSLEVVEAERRTLAGEPGEPVLDIGGVAGAPDLAVIDDVEADGALSGDRLAHRRVGQALELPGVVILAALLPEQQRGRARRGAAGCPHGW